MKFNIADCKLYVPVVTLQEKYENALLEGLKTGIDLDYELKRYRTQITLCNTQKGTRDLWSFLYAK